MPIIPLALQLAPLFPKLIQWVTGSDKAEQAAQAVVAVAQSVTGQKEPEAAVAALQADPAAVLSFQQKLAEMEGDLDKAYLADRQDARHRDVALRQTGQHNYRADILAFLAVGGLVTCVYFVATQLDLPSAAREAIMFVAGTFAAAIKDVYAFEFGSSRGSKEKDERIARLTEGPR